MADPSAEKMSPLARFGRPLVFAVLIAGALFMLFDSSGRDADLDGVGRHFFDALRAGDTAGAYAQLTARRRSLMPLAQFETLTDHPAFRGNTRAWLGPKESSGDGMCGLGGLVVDGQEWGMQVYFLEDGDTYAVHSFAIQPPTTVALGLLLPECGYWEGTTVGYSGPAIARTTRPTE